MLPLKKILWTTDFSDASKTSLRAAGEWALQFKSLLYALNVVDPIPAVRPPVFSAMEPADTGFNIDAYRRELEKASRESLKEIIDEELDKRVSAQPLVSYGNAPREIIRVADEKGVDMIVISTHGRTGLKHLVFGSVAEQVVRNAHVPVLVIRSQKKEENEDVEKKEKE